MKNLRLKITHSLFALASVVTVPAMAAGSSTCDPWVESHTSVLMANGTIAKRKVIVANYPQTPPNRVMEETVPSTYYRIESSCAIAVGNLNSLTGDYSANGPSSSDPLGDPTGLPNPVFNPVVSAGEPDKLPPVIVIGTYEPVNPAIFIPNPNYPPLFIPAADGGKDRVTEYKADLTGKVTCNPQVWQASSTDSASDRQLAANTLFNSMNMGFTSIYNRIMVVVYNALGIKNTVKLKVIFTDGGSETYLINLAMSSVPATPIPGTLVLGTDPSVGQCKSSKEAMTVKLNLVTVHVAPIVVAPKCANGRYCATP
jgi:hypothetical protein